MKCGATAKIAKEIRSTTYFPGRMHAASAGIAVHLCVHQIDQTRTLRR